MLVTFLLKFNYSNCPKELMRKNELLFLFKVGEVKDLNNSKDTLVKYFFANSEVFQRSEDVCYHNSDWKMSHPSLGTQQRPLVGYSDDDNSDSDFIPQTPTAYSNAKNPVLPGCSPNLCKQKCSSKIKS